MPHDTTKGGALRTLFLLCSFANSVPFPGKPPVDLPWLGHPKAVPLQSAPPTNSSNLAFQCEWQDCRHCEKTAGTMHFASCWRYELNDSNQWCATETLHYPNKPAPLPKTTRVFLMKKIRRISGTDVIEIYSPPRVIREAGAYGLSQGGVFDLTTATTLSLR